MDKPSSEADLLNRIINFHWEGIGWLEGTVVAANEDPEELDDDDVANWIVYYEAEDGECDHCLHPLDYSTAPDAPAKSWYLVRETA